MNIFMFVNYTPSEQSLGITKKISAEIAALRQLGHDVTYTAYEEDGIYIYDHFNTMVCRKKYRMKNQIYIKLMRYFLLVKCACDYMKANHHHFDIFYGRLLPPSGRYLDLLKLFKEDGSRIILEAHAYFPGVQFKSLKGKYVSYMLAKNGPKLKNWVDKILTEGHVQDFYGISEVCEANIGVETKSISPHQYQGSVDELNCISVGNETAYHAYDRIISSLALYYQNESNPHTIRLHFVGTVLSKTKKQIEKSGIQDRIILYGKRSGADLDHVYNQCNMGLGPFGQHRIGGKKDTGLKTKEYFAKGLPYIFSGEEPSVPPDYPYVLRFPSDESPVDFSKVWSFYQSYRDNKQTQEDMRRFAIEHYSWDSIMKQAIS